MDRPVCDLNGIQVIYLASVMARSPFARTGERKGSLSRSQGNWLSMSVRKGNLVDPSEKDAFAGAVRGCQTLLAKGHQSTQYVDQQPSTPIRSILRISSAKWHGCMFNGSWHLAKGYTVRKRSTDFRYSEFAKQALSISHRSPSSAPSCGTSTTWTTASADTSPPRKSSSPCWRRSSRLVIHRVSSLAAVDPNVPLKPSGVEWLGDVPAHWYIRRLKTVCGMRSGDGITSERIEERGDFPVYGGNGLRGYTSSYTHDGEFTLIGRQAVHCAGTSILLVADSGLRSTLWLQRFAPGHAIDWFAAILVADALEPSTYDLRRVNQDLAVERVLNPSSTCTDPGMNRSALLMR